MNPKQLNILRTIAILQPIDRTILRQQSGLSETVLSNILLALRDEGYVHMGDGYKAEVWLTVKGRGVIDEI